MLLISFYRFGFSQAHRPFCRQFSRDLYITAFNTTVPYDTTTFILLARFFFRFSLPFARFVSHWFFVVVISERVSLCISSTLFLCGCVFVVYARFRFCLLPCELLLVWQGKGFCIQHFWFWPDRKKDKRKNTFLLAIRHTATRCRYSFAYYFYWFSGWRPTTVPLRWPNRIYAYGFDRFVYRSRS